MRILVQVLFPSIFLAASAVFSAFGAGGLYVLVTFARLYLTHEWYCILNSILKT